jgi:hypothetical protein
MPLADLALLVGQLARVERPEAHRHEDLVHSAPAAAGTGKNLTVFFFLFLFSKIPPKFSFLLFQNYGKNLIIGCPNHAFYCHAHLLC